jgi:hypothetical protein
MRLWEPRNAELVCVKHGKRMSLWTSFLAYTHAQSDILPVQMNALSPLSLLWVSVCHDLISSPAAGEDPI